jgi:hypothetical protein
LCQYIFGCCVGQVAGAVLLVKLAFIFGVVFHFQKCEAVLYHMHERGYQEKKSFDMTELKNYLSRLIIQDVS